MRMGSIRMRATLAAGFVGSFTLQLWAQVAPSATPSRNPVTGDPRAITQGAVLFRQECVFCHGFGARGGVRGPDLTTGSWSHGGSDAELADTIKDGVAGTAMPPNNLTIDEIWQIVAYLRTLEQPMTPTAGDPKRGEALFFGAARCSTCHIVNGRGGLLGPELSTIGSARSRAYLIESVRADPERHIDVLRVHSLDKKTLKSLRHENRSLMPAYGADRLGNADLDDVIAYLQSLRAPTPVRKRGSSHEDQ